MAFQLRPCCIGFGKALCGQSCTQVLLRCRVIRAETPCPQAFTFIFAELAAIFAIKNALEQGMNPPCPLVIFGAKV
jgi:hypothetical protein